MGRAPYADLILMGRTTRAHGMRGEIKVAPDTDDPSRFEALRSAHIGNDRATALPFDIVSVRFQQSRYGTTVLLKLANVESRTEAEQLQRLSVFAREDDLPPLEDTESYLHDLVGLSVTSAAGAVIGKVADIVETAAHPILVVSRSGRADAMIPYVPEFITDVKITERVIVVSVIEGLFAD